MILSDFVYFIHILIDIIWFGGKMEEFGPYVP